MPASQPGNHDCTMARKTRNWPAATSSREEANWPSLRALSRRRLVGFSLLLESAMELGRQQRANQLDCRTGGLRKHFGEDDEQPGEKRQSKQHFNRAGQHHQVKLGVQTSEKR